MEPVENSAPSVGPAGSARKGTRRQRGCLIMFVVGIIGLWATTLGIMIIIHNFSRLPILIVLTLIGIGVYYFYMRR
ncbi:MAG TPA: hypothetical protein VKQ72_13495 [Aggregatilineales bacterium]|nr:hypothetical protein [Aggregatilineales bacterium]